MQGQEGRYESSACKQKLGFAWLMEATHAAWLLQS